jgi:hypothetical protein
MLRWMTLGAAALIAAAPLAAQDDLGGPDRTAMQARIERLFLDRAREEMGLDSAGAQRLLTVERRMVERRRAIEAENRRLNADLAAQLRPGVAADADRVARALDSLGTLRVSYAQVFRDEQRELAAFLTPVQRAQFYRLRERLVNRVAELREQRRPAPRRARP